MATTLFDRIGKRSILTPNGRAFQPRAENILEELQSYRSELSQQQTMPSGNLTLATSHHVGLHRLPSVLRDFKIRYPKVDLDLHFMDSEDACTAVINNELELAVVTLPESPDEGLICESIWIDQLVVVFALDHPLAEASVIEPEDLLEYAAILPSAGTFTRRIINGLFSGLGSELKIILETNYLETIKVMTAANLGWSILPANMLDLNLIGKPLAGAAMTRALGIVTRKKRTLSLSSTAMIDLLRSHHDI